MGANVCACVCTRLDVCGCVGRECVQVCPCPDSTSLSSRPPRVWGAARGRAAASSPEVGTQPGALGREPFPSSQGRFSPRRRLCAQQRRWHSCDGDRQLLGCCGNRDGSDTAPGARPPLGPWGGTMPAAGGASCTRSSVHTDPCARRSCVRLPTASAWAQAPGHGAAAGSPPPLPGRAVLVQSPRLPPASLGRPQRRREGARPCDRLSRPPGPAVCRQTRGPGPPQDAQEGLVLWASLWARAWPVGRGAWPSPRPLELQHPPHVWPRLARWLFLLATCHFSNTLLSWAAALADTDSLDLHSSPSGRSC